MAYSRLVGCAGIAVCGLSLLFAAPAVGDDPEDPAHIEEEETGGRKEVAFGAQGITFGVIFPLPRIGQAFDGESVIAGDLGDSLMLPRVDAGAGMGLTLGMLIHLPAIYVDLDWEFTLARADHSYTWQGQSGTLRNHYASLGISFAGPIQWRVQPYFAFGWSSLAYRLNRAIVRPGDEADSAWFYGKSFDVGFGANLYLNRRWKVWAEYGREYRRLTKYARHLPGVGYRFANEAEPKAGGEIFTFGATVTFPRPFIKK